MLSNIRIVLMETSHPGNIGGAARAMKNMGLQQLCLVNPAEFPSERAVVRAVGADDVLQRASVVPDLHAAIADCALVIGTSARPRNFSCEVLNPEAAATQALETDPEQTVAIVFGRERNGLTNTELQSCHFLVHIPCDENYSSLNLAAAVQVMSYELFKQSRLLAGRQRRQSSQPVTREEMERYYVHLEEVLQKIDFLDPDNPGRLMPRLRRLYDRARPDQREINILRGILSATEKNCDV